MRRLATLYKLIAFAFTLAFAGGLAHADTTVVWDTFDNSSNSTQGVQVGYVPSTDSSLHVMVKFVPTVSGYASSLTAPFIGPATGDTTLNFTLRNDAAGLPGNIVSGFSSIGGVSSGPVVITVPADAPTFLVAGQAYWLEVSSSQPPNVTWRSITSGVGTWFEDCFNCSNATITDNRAPALEVRVDSDILFDFNARGDQCYEFGSFCDYPTFDKYYNPTSYLHIGTANGAGGALPQQFHDAGVLQIVRYPLQDPSPSSVLMTMTVNGAASPGVKRFRFTLSNGNSLPVTVVAQLSGQNALVPATFTRTIPANSTQTICFNKSALDNANATYTGVTIESANLGPTPVVTWDNLYVDVIGAGADSNCAPPAALDNDPTPVGTNVPVVRLDQFLMTAAEVVTAGFTSADICIAPDPREVKQGLTWRYTPRVLRLSELANKGTCKGTTSDGGTWLALLNATGLEVSPWFRTFVGVSKIGGTGVLNVEAPWVVVAIIRTSAQYKGAVGVAPLAERLITYPTAQISSKNELQCDTTRDKRPLSLGGTVASFGDFMNVEDERMILETGQCDGGIGLTRRTTHVFPMRIDTTLYTEKSNAMTQLDGLGRTITRATCVDPLLITTLNGYLTQARAGVAAGNNMGYGNAVSALHNLAIAANNGGVAGQFSGCPVEPNYQGAFVVRAINSAFTVFDRLLYPNPNPNPNAPNGTWLMYFPPASINLPLTVQPPPPGP